MLKDKIFNLVNEKFENELKEKLQNTFECFESNIEQNKNVQSYDGFIAFVDGCICLSSPICTSSLITSGMYPSYLGEYVNHISNLAHEYSLEDSDDNQEIIDDKYFDYIQDDYFYIEVNFYWYDKDGKGHGQNKAYFDYSIKDEYGKTLYKVDQKAIDEACVSESNIYEGNYEQFVNDSINKIIEFI